MDKLLALEANELDLVLQYPAATRATVSRRVDIVCNARRRVWVGSAGLGLQM